PRWWRVGTYDKSFAVIARIRGLVTAEDLAAAESTLERRAYSSEGTTISSVLVESGKLDATKVAEIEGAMRRHALECTACAARTYLLPKQNEQEVRCES